jgi:sugar phosphate isomerase/epimerase
MNAITSRRTFLGGSAALAAMPASQASAAPQNGDIKLGVATYSLRKFTRPQAIEMIKKLGVEYVSIKEFHLRYADPREQTVAGAKEFRDAGLTILSGGNIDLKKPSELRNMFEYAKAAGMPTIVCAPSLATLPEVEKLCKEFDIRAAIHNHGPEDKHFPSPESVLKAVKNMDSRMGLCIDIGHTARTGADFVEWMGLAGARLFDIHVKDLMNPREKARQVAVGDGELPIVAMFKMLKKLNYKGGVMLEYEIEADNPLPGMMKSIGYEKGVLAALRA